MESDVELISSLAGGDDDATDTDDSVESVEEGSPASTAAASAPGAAPAAGAGGPAGDPNRDHVSNLNAALREERTARKQLEKRLAAIEARSQQSAPAVEAPPEPDFLEDPKGVVDKLQKRLDESEKQAKEREEGEKKQREQREQFQKDWNQVISAESEFAATTPDYHDALKHIRDVTTKQIKLQYPSATDEQIAQHIQQQEFAGARQIIADGRNPSMVYYEYAQLIGYRPRAAASAERPDKDSVRTMGSGGGDLEAPAEEGRSGSLSELGLAHAEMREERKKTARSR